VSETVTVSDKSLFACFVIIKNCFVVAASYTIFVGIRGSVTHFSELW